MIRRSLRVIIAAAACVFLIWFLAPIAYGILNIGNTLGIVLCVAVFLRCVCSPLYHRIKDSMVKRKLTKALLRLMQLGAAAFIVYAVLISSCMIYAMIPRVDDDATAVVLGAQVKPWGPSALLQQRIDAAVDYLKQHPAACAVVTGGKGEDEPVSEAACMRENMMKAGISDDRILCEDQARNTDENIRFSLKIVDEKNLNPNIAVVTDSYHQLRARIIAHKADPHITVIPVNTVNGYTGFWTYPTYFLREWVAIPVEIIK